MYLFGVDFEKIHREAVIEKVREEARQEREKVREEARDEERKTGLRNLMDSMSLTITQAMDALKIPEADRDKYAAMLSS